MLYFDPNWKASLCRGVFFYSYAVTEYPPLWPWRHNGFSSERMHVVFIHCTLPFELKTFRTQTLRSSAAACSVLFWYFYGAVSLMAQDWCTLPSLKHPLLVWSWPFVMQDKLLLSRQPVWSICPPIRPTWGSDNAARLLQNIQYIQCQFII